MEVHNIVEEVVIKSIPRKRNSKWLSEEALQIAEKTEVKNKGEKERYTHLNAEFQRKAWRDKKASLKEQCKDVEVKNRMGKTRHLLEKTRDTKGTFHAKMGIIKDRNGMNLTEAEEIKWRQNTQRTIQKRSSRPR